MIKQILLLEDDPEQSVTLVRKLARRYPAAQINRLESEFEMYTFLDGLERGEGTIPDIVIADVMMPWVIAMQNPPIAPLKVSEGGYSLAGIRCLEMFRQSVDVLVPWVFLSCREPKAVVEDLKNDENLRGVVVLSKERQANELIQEIEGLLNG